MKLTKIFLAFVVIGSLFLAACGSNNPPPGTPQNPTMLPGYPGHLQPQQVPSGFTPKQIGNLLGEFLLRWVDRTVHSKEDLKEMARLQCHLLYDDEGTFAVQDCIEQAEAKIDAMWPYSDNDDFRKGFDRRWCDLIEPRSQNMHKSNGVNQDATSGEVLHSIYLPKQSGGFSYPGEEDMDRRQIILGHPVDTSETEWREFCRNLAQ